MEMTIEGSYLPVSIKKKMVEELREMKFVLDDERPMGKGACGYLYRTRSTVKEMLSVCKVFVIPKSLRRKAKEDLMKSIEKEICNLKALDGFPGIVPIYYSKISPEFVMIGMEYFASGSLEQYVSGETMNESVIKSFAHQILSAMLDYSEQGIVHRDIKPENILIDSHGEIKISDFGLARDKNGQSKLSTRTIAGTMRYLSPELEDGVPQSIKSDIWAFGVVLLELTFGREAFKISKIARMSSAMIREEFRDRGGYSIDMVEIIAKCFERESRDRASVENLLKDKWFYGVQMNPSSPVIRVTKKLKTSPIEAVRPGNNI